MQLDATDAMTGTSILVIDDDLDALELMVGSLRRLGADVRPARSAEEALGLLAARRPDAVLCDLHLPDRDGYALLESIRTDATLDDVPVIAISASHPDVERERSTHAGFAQHLLKPTRLSDIVETTLDCIRRARAYALS
jgi:CheY-like chemotaxis protein